MQRRIGSLAPDFSLVDQDGDMRSLRMHRGDWILLYFYPKDDTPGCTKEACGLRDRWKKLQSAEVRVMGVSTDTRESHQKFAKRYDLPFPLLADTDKKVVKLYDAWKPKTFMGKEFLGTHRMSYLIDPLGKIVKIYEEVDPEKHADEVLNDVKQMRGTI